jgi:hypothetical protein
MSSCSRELQAVFPPKIRIREGAVRLELQNPSTLAMSWSLALAGTQRLHRGDARRTPAPAVMSSQNRDSGGRAESKTPSAMQRVVKHLGSDRARAASGNATLPGSVGSR